MAAAKPDSAKMPSVAQVDQCAPTVVPLTYADQLKLQCEQSGILTEFVPYLMTCLPEHVQRAFRYVHTLTTTGDLDPDDEQFFSLGSQTKRAPRVRPLSQNVRQAISKQKAIDVPEDMFELSSSEPDLVIIENLSSSDDISVSEHSSKLIPEREIQQSDFEEDDDQIPSFWQVETVNFDEWLREQQSNVQMSDKSKAELVPNDTINKQKATDVPEDRFELSSSEPDLVIIENLSSSDEISVSEHSSKLIPEREIQQSDFEEEEDDDDQIRLFCQVETVNFDEWLREQQSNVQMNDNSKAELVPNDPINKQNESHKSIRIKLKRDRDDGQRFSVEMLNCEDSNNADWSDQSGQGQKWKKSHN